MEPQILLDYHRVAPGGLTRARVSDVRPGIRVSQWDYVVVGDEDAEPAVAQVVEISEDRAILLRVLDGSVGTTPTSSTATGWWAEAIGRNPVTAVGKGAVRPHFRGAP